MSLASALDEASVEELRERIARGDLPGVSFEQAMKFLLTDGVLPASGLPARSFLLLEDWARRRLDRPLYFTATQLKNQTGTVVEAVLRGQTVLLTRHGRTIAEIRPTGSPF